MAYSIGCANRSPVSLWSITVMICCFTRPFFPVYSSGRSLITKTFTVIFFPFAICWRLFARTLPAGVRMRRVLLNPTGPRNAGGELEMLFRNLQPAAVSSHYREPKAPHPHLLGSRFFAWFPRQARSRVTLLPVRHLVLLREFSALSACCEILHGVLSHILPPTEIGRASCR